MDFSKLKPIGHTYIKDDIIWCEHSGSGAEFIAEGGNVNITLIGKGFAECRVAIYINEKRVHDLLLNEREKRVNVELDVTSVIRIIKLSEAAPSVFGIVEIEADSISPTAKKPLLIEFIGDSITCGYGVDDEDREHGFSVAKEDFTKTYAYKTAAALNADYTVTAFSGYGIISGYTDNGEKNRESILPPFYPPAGLSSHPDVIVINLGTNDDSYCGDDTDRQAEFEEAYVDFLEQIRQTNPSVPIICTLGIMGSRLYKRIETAVKDFDNVYTLKFTEQIEADGYAADWHPSEATHQKAALQLIEFIKEISCTP
jgi:lysophospholipase L1-like esterase